MSSHSEAFVRHLTTLAERDRGALAALRHSLSFELGTDPRVYPYVERFAGNDSHAESPRRLALYAIAGLFAQHPVQTKQSYATGFGELARRRQSASTETRFVALLEADAQNVLAHLRHTLSLFAAEDIGIDYARLLDDLSQWLAPVGDERLTASMRQRWARDFYNALTPDTAERGDAKRFLTHLETLDRAARSTLRRSLAFAPGDYPAAYPLIEPFVNPEWSIHDARRRARYLVAGLVALSPRASDRQTLATALGRVAQKRNSDSIEHRFSALLGADAHNVADHLRQAVRLIAAEDQAFDVHRLLRDLSTWLNPFADPAWIDRIRQYWARDFYGVPLSDAEPTHRKEQTEGA